MSVNMNEKNNKQKSIKYMKSKVLNEEEFNKELKKQVDSVKKMFDAYNKSKNNNRKVFYVRRNK